MPADKIILVICQFALVALWSLALRRRWPERVYEQTRDSAVAWFWFDTLHIPKAPAKCIRFIRRSWTAAVILSVVGTVAVLLCGG